MKATGRPATRELFPLLGRRMRAAWAWLILFFCAPAALGASVLLWALLPDRHGWQVLFTLLLGAALLVAALAVATGLLRALGTVPRPQRAPLWQAATGVLLLAAGLAMARHLLDRMDERIPLWSGYLNSRFPAGARATTFTYEHIAQWLQTAEGLLRWFLLPGLLLPLAIALAGLGLRGPAWRAGKRVLTDWRWWLGMALVSFFARRWPPHWLETVPRGAVGTQVLSAALRLGAFYGVEMILACLLLLWLAALSAPHLSAGPGQDATEKEEPLPRDHQAPLDLSGQPGA